MQFKSLWPLLLPISLLGACIGQAPVPTGELSRLGLSQPVEQCSEAKSGGLSVAFGALWFTPDGKPDAQGELIQEPTLLIEGPSGGLSELIPHPTPGKALMARQSLEISQESRIVEPPQLLELETSTLTPKVIWSAPKEAQLLRLMGRVGQRAIVSWDVAMDQDVVVTYVASIPLDGQIATEPVKLQGLNPASGEATEGATRWVLPAGKPQGALYVVDAWADGRISATQVDSKATQVIRSSATEVLLRLGEDKCAIAPLSAPEIWPTLEATTEGCELTTEPWLAPLVDGQLAPALVAATPPACATRDEIELEPLGPALDGALTAQVSLAPLPLPSDVPMGELTLRLLVRGERLYVEYFSQSGEGMDEVADWRVPLPPESVSLQPVMLEGQPFYEAMITLEIPVNPWPTCERGTLRVVASGPGSPAQRAVLEQEVSFGKCE